MENVEQVTYTHPQVAEDVEEDVSHTVKQTITQGLDDGGVLAFRVPADPERFTDLNTILLRLQVSIEKLGDEDLNLAEDKVTLDPGGMHSFFSTVEVKFNDQTVSTMTAYPYTAALSRYLGCSKDVRVGVWDDLDGTWELSLNKSSLKDGNLGMASRNVATVVAPGRALTGRIYSDVLMSSRQYLPPGVVLGIYLRRAPDHFSLVSTKEAEDSFKVRISSASLYIKRLKLRPSFIPRLLEKQESAITFNRLECRMMAIKKDSMIFRWLDCLQSSELPNRIYVAFIAQAGLYGKITNISTFFEPLAMKSLNFKLNGRDLLVEPIKTTFKKNDDDEIENKGTDARDGYLTIMEVLNMISDQTQIVRLSYLKYLLGNTFYAVELGKCGEKRGTRGVLDAEVEFDKADMDACMLIFSEKTETAQIPARLI